METEEKRVNKLLYKVELYLIKVIPMLIAACYFSNTTLSYFGIDAPIFSYIGGMSLLPLLFLYISSFVFKFCIYHRMFLHYILVSDIISYYDMYIGLPIDSRSLFTLNYAIAGLFLFLILYFKIKREKELNKTISKRIKK